ncbi:hypothetical protein OKA06_04845 [Novosphingobium sp. MW5]|nr:hypothetical protein [Novosphingobium sp. MW5]
MTTKTYKVIQWATGTVGKAALKYFIENPVTELVGVLVTNPDKVGKDAGDIVGLPKTGVLCTDSEEAILAMEADAVLFAPSMMTPPVDMVCRLLESGKNVISPAGPFLPNKFFPEHAARVEAACKAGGVSFHSCGIHPGFASDILPLTLARLMSRIDCIEVTEIIDKKRNPMIYTEIMGFGADCDELLANPRRGPDTYQHFYSSMQMIAEGLGVEIEKVTTRFEVSKATADITHDYGVVKKGTCGGQHYEWTAWVRGQAADRLSLLLATRHRSRPAVGSGRGEVPCAHPRRSADGMPPNGPGRGRRPPALLRHPVDGPAGLHRSCRRLRGDTGRRDPFRPRRGQAAGAGAALIRKCERAATPKACGSQNASPKMRRAATPKECSPSHGQRPESAAHEAFIAKMNSAIMLHDADYRPPC